MFSHFSFLFWGLWGNVLECNKIIIVISRVIVIGCNCLLHENIICVYSKECGDGGGIGRGERAKRGQSYFDKLVLSHSILLKSYIEAV